MGASPLSGETPADVRRASSSPFLVGNTVTGEDAGMEKPTTEEVGRVLGLAGPVADEGDVVGRKRDAHDLFGGVGGCDVGCDVDAEA